MSGSRYLISLFTIAALGLCGIAAANYLLDPAHLFQSGSYEDRLASRLLAGETVAATNHDDRFLQKRLIEARRDPADTIVLGSSRAMEIGSGFFKGRRVRNHSVHGGALEDYLALTGLYEENGGFHPAEAVLCVDPWIFNRHHGQKRWSSLAPEFARMERRLGGGSVAARPSGSFDKYVQLFSLKYLLASLVSSSRVSGEAAKGTEMRLLPDGSIRYNDVYVAAGPSEVAARALRYVERKPIYSLGEFRTLDAGYVKTFEALVEWMRSKGTRVRIVLLPYHPRVYARIAAADEYRGVREAEDYLKAFGSGKLDISGSYDPVAAGCTEADFYDGMHARPSCLEKVMTGKRDI